MAMVYMPRELIKDGEPSGLYHYSAASDEESWSPYPIGYCAVACPGHLDPGDSVRHYRLWQLDRESFLNRADAARQEKCQVCGDWTSGRAMVGVAECRPFVLCEQHNNAEDLRRLYLEEFVSSDIRPVCSCCLVPDFVDIDDDGWHWWLCKKCGARMR